TEAPDADSDHYWNTRPLDARIAAVASAQSRPIASRAAFLEKIEAAKRTHGTQVPRPARWGGYRVWAERVELWVGQPARVHDRARWTRSLTPEGEWGSSVVGPPRSEGVWGSSVAGPPSSMAAGFKGGAWSATRLQ